MTVNGRAVVGFGVHEGHQVHPHDHAGQDAELFRCSGRWLCMSSSCMDKDEFPRGTWFAGPVCAKPRAAARESAR